MIKEIIKKKTKVWELDTWWKKAVFVIGIISIVLWLLSFPFGIIIAWSTSFTEKMQQQENLNYEEIISNITQEYQILYDTCTERINQCNDLLKKCS